MRVTWFTFLSCVYKIKYILVTLWYWYCIIHILKSVSTWNVNHVWSPPPFSTTSHPLSPLPLFICPSLSYGIIYWLRYLNMLDPNISINNRFICLSTFQTLSKFYKMDHLPLMAEINKLDFSSTYQGMIRKL